MKRHNNLEMFIAETLRHDKAQKEHLLKEFLDSAIQAAVKKIERLASEEEKKSTSASTTKVTRIGDKPPEKLGDKLPGKMFDKLGKEGQPEEEKEEDDDVETKAYIDNKDKITLLQKSDKDFNLIVAYSKKVANNLTSVVAKMSTDKRTKVKKSITQFSNLQQNNMNKYFQMLKDSFKDAGDEQDILTKISMLAIVTKVIQDMEKSAK